MKKIITIAICLLSLSGCGLYKNIDLSAFKSPNNQSQDLKDEKGVIPKVVSALKNASKDDCIFLYKGYSGMSEYLIKSKNIVKTSQVLPPTGIMVTFANDYGWTPKYPELTQVVKEDLGSFKFKVGDKEVGFDDVHDISDEERKVLSDRFSLYAAGSKIAAEGK